MRMKYAIMLPLFLVACSSPEEPTVRVITEPVKLEAPQFESPDSVKMRKVVWNVVTADNASEIIQAAPGGQLYALDKDSYTNWTLNTIDSTTLIRQQRAIIAAHKNYLKKE